MFIKKLFNIIMSMIIMSLFVLIYSAIALADEKVRIDVITRHLNDDVGKELVNGVKKAIGQSSSYMIVNDNPQFVIFLDTIDMIGDIVGRN